MDGRQLPFTRSRETTTELLEKLGIPVASPDALRVFPDKASVKSFMTPVRDQGEAGTCATFCVVALLEQGSKSDYSEACLTHEAEKHVGDCLGGLPLGSAMAMASINGVVDEQWWPYNDKLICWPTPPNTAGRPRKKMGRPRALWHKTRAAVYREMEAGDLSQPPRPYALPFVQTDIHFRKSAVAVSVPVFRSAWYGGDVQMPTRAVLDSFLANPKRDDLWHCVAVVSYDRANKRYEFKNSWGEFSGHEGYYTIPYEYIERYSDIGMDGFATQDVADTNR